MLARREQKTGVRNINTGPYKLTQRGNQFRDWARQFRTRSDSLDWIFARMAAKFCVRGCVPSTRFVDRALSLSNGQRKHLIFNDLLPVRSMKIPSTIVDRTILEVPSTGAHRAILHNDKNTIQTRKSSKTA